eukprot:CAMPEP_0204196762 /NCGR_PEP_ID=MMETSP0361-20130328/64070_1 /ASSEMBLY_ACC=CAM_ASM_000343 /TAXON_ID=268821 /ORGANISM="Scrippsiella Hangoei, Strain SHTV-5" /LENGTH=93 /DNA_ID=CAMNT_0051158567 /DNA_START=1 /DNA_END=282 /DNA_ORIENTATION=+
MTGCIEPLGKPLLPVPMSAKIQVGKMRPKCDSLHHSSPGHQKSCIPDSGKHLFETQFANPARQGDKSACPTATNDKVGTNLPHDLKLRLECSR